jgi:poly(A) polymerase
VDGRKDLADRVIRAIGDPWHRLEEDRLRMLRAIRFAARFDFRIDDLTFRAIRENAAKIEAVSAERQRDELIHIFTGPHPDRGLDLLNESGLLAAILPEVLAMQGVAQPEVFHPEGDAFEHTRKMLGFMGKPSIVLAFGVLLHDIGKPRAFTVDGRIRFPAHEKLGAEIAEQVCVRLRFSNEQTKGIVGLVGGHMRFKDVTRMKKSTLKRFLRQEGFGEHLELHRLDCLASTNDLSGYEYCRQLVETLPEEVVRPEPLITGHDLIELGLTPGPTFGQILKEVEDAQLEETLKTREEALSFVRERFLGKEAGTG